MMRQTSTTIPPPPKRRGMPPKSSASKPVPPTAVGSPSLPYDAAPKRRVRKLSVQYCEDDDDLPGEAEKLRDEVMEVEKDRSGKPAAVDKEEDVSEFEDPEEIWEEEFTEEEHKAMEKKRLEGLRQAAEDVEVVRECVEGENDEEVVEEGLFSKPLRHESRTPFDQHLVESYFFPRRPGTYRNVQERGKAEEDSRLVVMKEEERKKQVVEGQGDEEDDEEEISQDEESNGNEQTGKKWRQRDYEVFIGGLSRETTKKDLEVVFGKVGVVVEVRLVEKSFWNNRKGFAFIRFATVEQARKAVELKSVQLRGSYCGISRNNSNVTICLRNICKTWTKDDLIKKLNSFKLDNLEEVHLDYDRYNKGENRGCAFLEFRTHEDAVTACYKLQMQEIFLGTDARAEITFGNNTRFNEKDMSELRSVFVDGLPLAWNEFHVRKHFMNFGEIDHVKLAQDMPNAKRVGFGFISFKTKKAAMDCIDAINNGYSVEGEDQILLRATFKRHFSKWQPLKSSRRGLESHESPHYKRSVRSIESDDMEHREKIRLHNRFSSRHVDNRIATSSTTEEHGMKLRMKYDNHRPRTDYDKDRNCPSAYQWRTRCQHRCQESCSSHEHSFRLLKNVDETHVNVQKRCLDDKIYEAYYEHEIDNFDCNQHTIPMFHEDDDDDDDAMYEDCHEHESDAEYEYVITKRLKRRCTNINNDLPAPSSMIRHSATRSGLKMKIHPQHASPACLDYSRILRDECIHCDHDQLEKPRRICRRTPVHKR